ncbi:hypothetical protein [Streptomyces acidicola]|uniref:hypothetical protein n=1 Tax=Streptomyces acidicola TaxID=2596892 RepID=UPI00343347C9
MAITTSALKNEYTKRAMHLLGIRKTAPIPKETPHYRMPALQAGGGHLVLRKYSGPEIPSAEWESLEYTTYATDPHTFFAPITSPTGRIELVGACEAGKKDLDCTWTPNAQRCPTIVAWLESIGARFGRVQLLRMAPNTLRECRWGLHLDVNNAANPESSGWIVRVWLELTDDHSGALLVRPKAFARSTETSIRLPKYQQAVVDSEKLWHGGHHKGPGIRYALIASFESSPELERWITSQLP